MRLRLVHWLERSWGGTLLSGNRRLPRRTACRSGQQESGRGINPGLSALAGGAAVGAEHTHEFQETDRSGRIIVDSTLIPPNELRMPIHLKRTNTILRPDQSRVLL